MTDAFERIVEESGDADAILRSAVSALADLPGVAWAEIAFLDRGELVSGPAAGAEDVTRRASVPILFDGVSVGELRADGDIEPELLERVADLVAPYVLIGWDTGGEAWVP
jgi:hypothetical protein